MIFPSIAPWDLNRICQRTKVVSDQGSVVDEIGIALRCRDLWYVLKVESEEKKIASALVVLTGVAEHMRKSNSCGLIWVQPPALIIMAYVTRKPG